MHEDTNSNDLQEIITHAIEEIKNELGDNFDLQKINLAELSRRTNISRSKLRRLKKNGFKALIYMHRYQPDLLARMRTDYVHEQQERYRTQLQMLEENVQTASPSERTKINKQIAKLRDQSAEIQKYEEKIHHLADQMIAIDLDDGVKVNYAKFQDVLEKIK